MDKTKALVEAHQISDDSGAPVYAIQAYDGTWYTNSRKPGLRSSLNGKSAETICCYKGREEFA